VKIAICIPCHRDTKALFTLSLARMIAHTLGRTFNLEGAPVRPQIETFVYFSSSISHSRNELVKWSREWSADHILWLDDDHVFPPDTLARLLAWNKPVVGVNFLRRGPGALTVAFRDREMVWSTPAKAKASPLEEVTKIGLGVCLMRSAALNGIEEPLFRSAPGLGEDYYLMSKLREAGIGIFVDHALSMESGHIDDRVLSFAQPAAKTESGTVVSALPASGSR